MDKKKHLKTKTKLVKAGVRMQAICLRDSKEINESASQCWQEKRDAKRFRIRSVYHRIA